MARTKLPEPKVKCLELAALQHGLITRAQALDAGMAPWTITDELTRGTWVHVRAGVYRTADAPPTWRQRALATCIGRACGLAISHRSAAYLHGLLPTPPEPLEVLAAHGTSSRALSQLARVHRVRVVPTRQDIVTIEGLPATSLPRTLTDLAAGTAPRELQELVDRAMCARPSDGGRRWLFEALQAATPGRHGASALRDALALWGAGAGGPGHDARQVQSLLEAEVLRILTGAGIPRPVCQYPVELPGGRCLYLDFAWPEERLALEVDGYAFHSDRKSFDHDRVRGNLLLTRGWQVLHTTAGEVRRNRQSLVATVREAHAMRRSRSESR